MTWGHGWPRAVQEHGQAQRHAHEVGRRECVASLLQGEGILAGAELLVAARPGSIVGEKSDLHVGEVQRDFNVAAADAVPGAIHYKKTINLVGFNLIY
jgi:hypothetical protein